MTTYTINTPCYNCPDRNERCHNESCPHGYMDFKAKLDRRREAKHMTADADAHTKHTIEINAKRAKTKRRVGQR